MGFLARRSYGEDGWAMPSLWTPRPRWAATTDRCGEESLKVWIVAISVFLLAGSSLSCGQTASRAAERHDLDRVVPRLPSGLSIEEVERRLGEPEAKFEVEDSEVVLTYRLWQAVFRPSLYKRTRRYLAGERLGDRPVASLDREIPELPLGSSRAVIERKLGKTEAWQILEFKKRERVWYGDGRWKLSLRNGLLAGKENTEQVAEPSAP
jgi:hypothetical protein